MTVLELAQARQTDLVWAVLGVAFTELVFRVVRTAERRGLRVTWVFPALRMI